MNQDNREPLFCLDSSFILHPSSFRSEDMDHPSDTSFEHLPLAAKRRIDAVCERFEQAWKAGRPNLESYSNLVPAAEQAILFVELLHVELERRRRAGEMPRPEEYLGRFPGRDEIIRAVFAVPL